MTTVPAASPHWGVSRTSAIRRALTVYGPTQSGKLPALWVWSRQRPSLKVSVLMPLMS
jgi:hypothetical protein